MQKTNFSVTEDVLSESFSYIVYAYTEWFKHAEATKFVSTASKIDRSHKFFYWYTHQP